MRAIAPLAPRRWLAALLFVLAAIALGGAVTAQEPPGDHVWSLSADQGLPSARAALRDLDTSEIDEWQAPLVEQRAGLTCDQLQFSDAQDDVLTLTDADLLANGASSRFCLYFDPHWDSYYVELLNLRSVDEFRQAKSQFQPMLARAGINACDIGFWSTPDRTIGRALSSSDLKDAGQRCEPTIYSHGPKSAARVEEARGFLKAAVAKGEEVFLWPISWPLRVHLYDDHSTFLTGIQTEGGDTRATERSIRFTYGRTTTIANGMEGFMVDLARFPQPTDLQMLISHEYTHVAQAGALGGSSTLPYFVIEGGAEYFASLIVGPEQRDLAGRYREAVSDERANAAIPLRELVDRPGPDDSDRALAGYSRGYAAMRLLTSRWGAQSYAALLLQNKNGTPAHYLEALTQLTGLSLDGFDQQVSAFLRDPANTPTTLAPLPTVSPTPRPGASPTPSPRATPAPVPAVIPGGSQMLDIVAARSRPSGDGTIEEASIFGGADRSVFVIFHWSCLDHQIQGEARVIAPDGSEFAAFRGTNGPGCADSASIELVLDEHFGGRTARSQPGAWLIEIYADGALQASLPFTLTT